ncbi:MAG: TonB-dependent receptor plug domain-containing protein, partial [Opitutaceae bacterium]
MNTPSSPRSRASAASRRRLALATAAAVLLARSASAQSTAPSAATDEEEAQAEVVLSPFIVQTSSDVGYEATESLAGTGLATKLTDVAAAISVVTSKFFKDTASTDLRDVLVYQPNVEVTGLGGNFSGVSPALGFNTGEPSFTNNTGTRVRGLASATQARNFYRSLIPLDSYNTDRLEINRGANSLLFGVASPAGIINYTTTRADVRRSFRELSLQFGSHDSRRAAFDVNQVIREDELAVRVAAVSDHEKFQQKPAFNTDERFYAAAEWRIKQLERGILSGTTLRANFAIAQGVQPWLEFSYGNTIYPGGGETGLGGGFPASPEALAAWDNWARALVERYKDRVHEWEIWNEPDLNRSGAAKVEAYIDLYIRTATMVRELQPRSRLWALGLAGRIDYADQFLEGMKSRGKLDLVDAITIHGYPRNPDDTSNIDKLRAVIAKHGAQIEVRQGETGAPSKYQENFALSRITWTETTQAKWDLRRMLAHHAKDVPFNLFTMSDMHYMLYPGENERVMRMNYKGLLGTNPGQTISHVKPVYHAARTVFSLFDDTVKRLPDYPFTTTALRKIAVAGYASDTAAGAQFVTVWFNDAPPAEASGVTRADVTLPAGKFVEPVLIDVRTSTVYALAKDSWSQTPGGATFRALPIYDSPMVIAERKAVPLTSS